MTKKEKYGICMSNGYKIEKGTRSVHVRAAYTRVDVASVMRSFTSRITSFALSIAAVTGFAMVINGGASGALG